MGDSGKRLRQPRLGSRDSPDPDLRPDIDIETTTTARLRLVTAAAPVEGAKALRFLRLGAGGPRGLWARGEHWIAHRGTVAVLEPGAGADRFRRVKAGARELVGATFREEHDPTPDSLRFFGGFAFAHDHRPEGAWQAFPAGLFHLPRVELRADVEGKGRLRIRARLGEGEDPGRVEAELRSELDAMRRRLAEEDGAGGAPPSRARVREGAEVRAAWERAVEEALAEIARGRFSKAVLARTMDVLPAPPADPVDVVGRLWRQNRGTHAFLFEPRPGHALVGAAPETVATLRRGVFHATAVAGSTRAGVGDAERERLARALLASIKDRQEQRLVVEDMVARLAPLAGSVRVQGEPHVLALARIQHLETVIRARLDPARHVLDLVEALHPTPAVCGVPRDEALAFLREEEPFDRGWYAGPVGMFDVRGGGVFVPALRTAVCRDGAWRLFAGAGIVAGSEPGAEWEETRIKFEAVLRALLDEGEER